MGKPTVILVLALVFSLHEISNSQQVPRTRFYRQNTVYNFRPQSAVIDDELEFRSYDNNFNPIREDSQSSRYGYKPQQNLQQQQPQNNFNSRYPSSQNPNRGGGGGGGGGFSSFNNRNPFSSNGPQNFGDDDDYSTDLLPDDDDDVETDPPNLPPSPRHNYNSNNNNNNNNQYRPNLGPRPSPPPTPRRYWDDQSGRERGDPSYSFGYDLYDQARHENSDVYGNVNGDFSFIDDEGVFRKISYTAGANRGFEVLHKTPSDPPTFPSAISNANRRVPQIKKPYQISDHSPRLPPVRVPNPNPTRAPNRGPPPPPPDNSLDGAGISINVGRPSSSGGGGGGSGSGGGGGGGSRDRVTGGSRKPNINNGGVGGGSPPGGNGEIPTSPNDGNGGENGEGGEGPKSWGALSPSGTNANQGQGPNRPRMRKRKPSLVVKVKRPAATNPNQNPGRPLHGGPPPQWNNPKKQPTPTPAPYPDDTDPDNDDPDRYNEDVDNEVDLYPKDKSYSFGYNTGDQTRQEVSDAYGNIRGSYSYIDPQGLHRTVHYTAGHSGFKVLNAQPSYIQPVYTEAPVHSISIPLPHMSQYSQVQIPQPSTVIYHIHPDSATAAWKPWEPTRISTKSSSYIRPSSGSSSHRHRHHRRVRARNSSSSSQAQNNLFRLTHENRRFFPTYNSIIDLDPASTTEPTISLNSLDEAEALSYIEKFDDNVFLKQLQQQQRRRHKIQKLQKQFQEQAVFQYTRPKASRARPTKGYNSESADETPLEDQQFSDYDSAPVNSLPVNTKLQKSGHPKGHRHRHHNHRHSKEKLQKLNEETQNSSASPTNDSSVPQEGLNPPVDPTPTMMAIEGEAEIQSYQGGYGDKNPLLVISETSSTPSAAPTPSVRTRLQRKTSSREMRKALSREKSAESTPVPDSVAAESMVMHSVVRPDPKSEEAKPKSEDKKTTYKSPAALLSAKMSSPPPTSPPQKSASAISLPTSMMMSRTDENIPVDMKMETLSSIEPPEDDN